MSHSAEHVTRLDQACTASLQPQELPVARSQDADAQWVVAADDGAILARCSLWWRHTPAVADQRTGFIGHYAAETAEAAQLLLGAACTALAEQGCERAIGPIDGSTWQRYRCVTQRGDQPPFLLEPDSPDDWPDHFRAAGFHDFAHYISALVEPLSIDAPQPGRRARVAQAGISIRPIDACNYLADLRRLYQVVNLSFQHSLLYSPIDQEHFVSSYLPLQSLIQPELILLAEHAERLVGFIFALPDLCQAQRGQPVDTLIIKTLAVLPEYQSRGVGGLLVAQCEASAARQGYRRSIHALMHESNRSHAMSARYARPIRRYTLFERNLL